MKDMKMCMTIWWATDHLWWMKI